jgi:GT2 family glycosyltransferase
MKKLSVLISFKNEGEEVARTCKSVRDTAGEGVDIIVLNDASDPFDYKTSLEPYNVKYYESTERLGSSLGKEFCVEHCETPYFLILDAHCRLSEGWLNKALEILERGEDCIYCCRTRFFSDDEAKTLVGTDGYGAYYSYSNPRLLGVNWNIKKLSDTEFEVPSILGANYLCSKRWWNYIKGFQGLQLYGAEEPYISKKSWLLGGKVKCIPQILTYHKQRVNKKFPYTVQSHEILHNELVIAYTVFPDKWEIIRNTYFEISNEISYGAAMTALNSHKDELNILKAYYMEHTQMPIAELEKYNKEFCKTVGVKTDER